MFLFQQTAMASYNVRHDFNWEIAMGIWKKGKKNFKKMSEVEFEPTPSLEDQNLSMVP